MHTPGHSPGGVCLLGPDGHAFSGDTLFNGGPGATGRSYSDFPTIIESIRDRLLVLPGRIGYIAASMARIPALLRPLGDAACILAITIGTQDWN